MYRKPTESRAPFLALGIAVKLPLHYFPSRSLKATSLSVLLPVSGSVSSKGESGRERNLFTQRDDHHYVCDLLNSERRARLCTCGASCWFRHSKEPGSSKLFLSCVSLNDKRSQVLKPLRWLSR